MIIRILLAFILTTGIAKAAFPFSISGSNGSVSQSLARGVILDNNGLTLSAVNGEVTIGTVGGGAGTVTSVNNGDAFSEVATGTTTPVITINSTSIYSGTIFNADLAQETGVSVQAWDTDLDSLAALSYAANGTLFTVVDNAATMLARGTNHYVLKVNGENLAWEAEAAGGGGGASDINGLSDGQSDGNDFLVLGNGSALNVSGAENLIIGINSNNGASPTSFNNVVIGHDAFTEATSTDSNVIIGHGAGDGITTSDDNVIIGYQAGGANNWALNTLIGKQAGNTNSGNSCTGVGALALETNTGAASTSFGVQAGENNTGGFSTLIGYQAGQNNAGVNATVVGARSSTTAHNVDDAVVFGYDLEFTDTTTNGQLLIGSGTYGPIITGDLTTNGYISINGDLRMKETVSFTSEINDGDSSTADTIDWTIGNKHRSRLTGAVTYTFTAPAGPTNLILKLEQDDTGSRTATWPATVLWPGGTAPTLTTTANGEDLASFYFDGTNYYGQAGLDFQ